MTRSSFGWVEIILGILMILLGFLAMFSPVETIQTFVIAYAIVAIISGIADIVFYTRMRKRTGLSAGWTLGGGIVSIIAGVVLLFFVREATAIFTILFPIWFIVHCIVRLFSLGYVRDIGGAGAFWVSLIANVAGIVLGILLLMSGPLGWISTLGYFIAFYLLLVGFSSLFGGIMVLSGRGRGGDDTF